MGAKPEAGKVWIEHCIKREIPKALCVVIGGDAHNAGDLFIIVDLDRNRPITACLESRERAWEEAFDGILDYVAGIRQSRRHGGMQDIEVKQVSLTVAELAEAITRAIVEYERKTLDEYQAC
jgi:hypothetical protein